MLTAIASLSPVLPPPCPVAPSIRHGQIVVVDDGSADGTVQTAFSYVRKYGFDTMRLLRLPRNCGKARGNARAFDLHVARCGNYAI